MFRLYVYPWRIFLPCAPCLRGALEFAVLWKVCPIGFHLFSWLWLYPLAIMLPFSLCIFIDGFQDHNWATSFDCILHSVCFVVFCPHFTLCFQYSTALTTVCMYCIFYCVCLSFPVDVEPLIGNHHILFIFVSPTVLCLQIFMVLSWFK